MNTPPATQEIPVVGANPTMARLIRGSLAKYPGFFVRAARLNRIIVSNRPDVRAQIAMYEHGTRDLYVWVGVGDILHKAVGHELGHAVDDIFDVGHYFTGSLEWQKIHRNQSHFDLPKYQEEALEYFADMVTKVFILGPQKLATTNPDEVRFITTWVFPTLMKEFGE